VAPDFELGMVTGQHARVKSDLSEDLQPDGPREQSLDVTIVDDAGGSIVFAEQVRVVDEVSGVGTVGSPAPFEIAPRPLPSCPP